MADGHRGWFAAAINDNHQPSAISHQPLAISHRYEPVRADGSL
jgi:hypothetical protein